MAGGKIPEWDGRVQLFRGEFSDTPVWTFYKMRCYFGVIDCGNEKEQIRNMWRYYLWMSKKEKGDSK